MNFMYKKFCVFFLYLFAFLFVFCGTSKIFAGDIQEKKSLVILNNNEKLMSQIKNKKQACELLNHKVVAYIDLIYYVKNCNLMLIIYPEVSNKLIQVQKKSIISLSAEIYSMMPIGRNYTFEDYYLDYENNSDGSLQVLCQKYNKWVVTSDSVNYYFIDSCKKRLFKKFSDISLFTDKSKPIFSLNPRILNKIPTGSPIVLTRRDSDSVIVIPETQIKANLPSAKILCSKLDRKVVSFHHSFFFLENCKLYTITDFNLDIQKKADNFGGVKELTVKQVLGIPQVGIINSNDVLNKMR